MTNQQAQTDLLDSQLWQAGFMATRIKVNAVRVSLSSRQISKMEVENFLNQEFEGCEFTLEYVFNGIEVTVI